MQVEKRENLMEVLQSEIERLRQQRSMPKVKIFEDGIAVLDDGVKWIPIPPETRINGPIRVEARLLSTRRGRAAWWSAKGVELGAPFNPFVRFVASAFWWGPPASLPSVEEEPLVMQGGSEVINWYAVVAEPIADPVKIFLRHVAEKLEEDDNVFRGECRFVLGRQGHLTVFSLPPLFREASELLWRNDLLNRESYRLFNHFIVPIRIAHMAWRVLQGVYPWAWALVRTTKWIRSVECWIVSPDHPDPIRVWEDGWFVLRHPLPDRSVD